MASQESKKSVIIDISVLNKDAIQTIQEVNNRIDELKKKQKELADQNKKNTTEYIQNAAELKNLNTVLRANEKELQNNINSQKQNADSLNAMRAQLKSLRAEYEDLSKADRDSAVGKEMLDNISNLTSEISKLEEAQGDYTRSVGHYQNAVQNLGGAGSKAIGFISALSKGTMKLSDAFKGGVTAVKAFGKELLSLLANPIVAAIAAIVAILAKLWEQFKKNDEAMTALESLMASFKPIIDIFNKGLQSIVGVLTKIVEVASKAVQSVMQLIPGLAEYSKQEEDLVRSKDKLEDSEREYAENSAKREKKVAELKDKAVRKDLYTAEQRRKFTEEAIALEKQELTDKQAISKERLRTAEQDALIEIGYTKMTKEAWDKLTDEQKNKISDLRVAVTNAEKEFYQGTRRLESQMSTFNQEIEAENKEAAKNAKERADKTKEAYKDLYSTAVGLMQDSLSKQLAQLKQSANNEINTLKDKLKTEKNLTSEAKRAMNERIILLEADLQLRLAELRDKYNAESLKQNLEYQKQIVEQRLELANLRGKGELQKEIIKIEFEISDSAFEGVIANIKKQKEQIDSIMSSGNIDEYARQAGMSVQEYTEYVYTQQVNLTNQLAQQENLRLLNKKVYDKRQIDSEVEKNKTIEQLNKQNAEKQYDIDVLTKLYNLDVEHYADAEVRKSQILEEQAAHRVQVAQAEVDRLKNLTSEQISNLYETDAEYQAAVLGSQEILIQSQQSYTTAMNNTTTAQKNQEKAVVTGYLSIAGSIGTALGAMNGFFQTLAEDNKKYQDFATGMAMAQILVSAAVATAQAIQAATEAGGFTGPAAPITIPIFIAEMVAIVMSAITSSISTLKQAEAAKQSTPSFATGGYVRGAGTSTSDSISARLSNGEFVMNAAATKKYLPLLSALNGGSENYTNKYSAGGYVDTSRKNLVDYDVFREIMTDAVSEVQPVVSVKEISNIQKRVQTKERISSNK